VGNMAWGSWSSLGPVIAHRDLGGAATWGSILAAMGVGALIGSAIAVRARPRRPLVLATLSYSPFVLTMAFLAAGAPAVILAFGALLAGGAMMLGNSVWESTVMRHVPDEWLSRVSAYDWFGSLAFQPLGLAMWGPIAGAIGVSSALWIATGVTLASNLAMLSTPAIRHLRNEPQRV
jgi:MFS family permease